MNDNETEMATTEETSALLISVLRLLKNCSFDDVTIEERMPSGQIQRTMLCGRIATELWRSMVQQVIDANPTAKFQN